MCLVAGSLLGGFWCLAPRAHPLGNQPGSRCGRGKHCYCSERLWVFQVFRRGQGKTVNEQFFSKRCFLEYLFPTLPLRTLPTHSLKPRKGHSFVPHLTHFAQSLEQKQLYPDLCCYSFFSSYL